MLVLFKAKIKFHFGEVILEVPLRGKIIECHKVL
jgi:hypothetical protein